MPVVLATDKRLSILPMSTSIEAGFPTVQSENWYGVLAPKGTPRQVLEALDRAIATAMVAPKIEESFLNLGVYVVKDGTPGDIRRIPRHSARQVGWFGEGRRGWARVRPL